ncbi:MAG: hypothetical protein DMG13_28220 [Acidobacteria bacterium]|nr:MAG: hypothetical protein DMG13_28220 [Acidobacteriota bacterium]
MNTSFTKIHRIAAGAALAAACALWVDATSRAYGEEVSEEKRSKFNVQSSRFMGDRARSLNVEH